MKHAAIALALLLAAPLTLPAQDDELEKLRKENEELKARIRELQSELGKSRSQVDEARRAYDEAVKAREKASEGHPKVMDLDSNRAYNSRRVLEGEVTAVAGDIDLVVLSLGKDHGVRGGQIFTVTRDGKYVAKVQVDRVDRKWSAAKIRAKNSLPRVGDTVIGGTADSSWPDAVLEEANPEKNARSHSKGSSDAIESIRKELDEIREQVRKISDRLLPSWKKYGVAFSDVPEDMLGHFGISGGLVVREVEKGSIAEKAGLQKYDIIPGKTREEVLQALERKGSFDIIRSGRKDLRNQKGSSSTKEDKKR